jgi:oxygen-dependent protoporphyrinogen oxidase
MGSLVEALESTLKDVRKHASVSRVFPVSGGWAVEVHGEVETFDSVVLACGAPQQARMTAFDPQLSADLGSIRATTTVTIQMVFAESQFRHELSGSGFVVPHIEGQALTACTYSHRKYAGRAPEGKALLRCHLGNAMRQDIVRLADCELVDLALGDLRPLLGLRGQPQSCIVSRHWEVLPQYDVGHLRLVERIESCLAAYPGLLLAGNALGGVGVADCVARSRVLAERQLAGLSQPA